MSKRTHYQYAEILKKTGISTRTFRYRIKELQTMNTNKQTLFMKKNNKWWISKTLISFFYKRNKSQVT